jgi:hypothetical protein
MSAWTVNLEWFNGAYLAESVEAAEYSIEDGRLMFWDFEPPGTSPGTPLLVTCYAAGKWCSFRPWKTKPDPYTAATRAHL